MKRKPGKVRPSFVDMMKAFGCVDAMLERLAEGWIHELHGRPVFLNPADGAWYEIPAALAGWIALWERIDAKYGLDLELDIPRKIVARLDYGAPIPPELAEQCKDVVKACKRAYRSMDIYEIGSIVKTQMIANRIEEMGIARSDQS